MGKKGEERRVTPGCANVGSIAAMRKTFYENLLCQKLGHRGIRARATRGLRARYEHVRWREPRGRRGEAFPDTWTP